MTRLAWVLPVVAAGALAPVVVRAPRPERVRPEGVETIADAIRVCRASGLQGWALVDRATVLVHEKFTKYSAWHLWETPGEAFRNSRGYCNQYNLALAEVLRGLGFDVTVVHAARVRMGSGRPWWHSGHAWLRVTHEGRVLDVCASSASNRAGVVGFTPVTDPRPFTRLTQLDTPLASVPFVVWTVWDAWRSGRDVPSWLFRDFDA